MMMTTMMKYGKIQEAQLHEISIKTKVPTKMPLPSVKLAFAIVEDVKQ
jgi:hypothetical protein